MFVGFDSPQAQDDWSKAPLAKAPWEVFELGDLDGIRHSNLHVINMMMPKQIHYDSICIYIYILYIICILVDLL